MSDLWKSRASKLLSHGCENPEELFNACNEYFEWIKSSPITGEKLTVTKKGKEVRSTTNSPHVMSIWGLVVFIGITEDTWYRWRRERKDLKHVIAWAENVMKEQKLSGATTGHFNARIISNILGLANKQTIQHLDKDEKPTDPPMSAADAYRALLDAD